MFKFLHTFYLKHLGFLYNSAAALRTAANFEILQIFILCLVASDRLGWWTWIDPAFEPVWNIFVSLP